MPQTSIIIPSHNEGDFLVQTVRDVLDASSDHDVELIVVDDCSDDDSGADAARVFCDDGRVCVVLSSKRLGAVGARVAGVDRAAGDFLVFVDAHTRPTSGWLSGLLRTLEIKSDAGIVTGTLLPLDGDARGLGNVITGPDLSVDFCSARPTSNPYPVMIAPLGCLAMKRSTYSAIGGLDTGLRPPWSNEDIDLSIRCWMEGYTVYVVPTVEVRTLFHETFPYPGVTATVALFNRLRIAIKYFDWPDVEKVFTAHKDYPELPRAVALLLGSDTYNRRIELQGRCSRNGSWLLDRFGVSL